MVFIPKKDVTVDVPKISFAQWILQIFRKRAAQEKIVLIWADNGTYISYGDLLRDSVRIATGMKAKGAKSGDVIALVTRNSSDVASFVLGCIFADMVLAPSVPELSANELRSNFQTTKPRYILTTPEKAPVVAEAISEFNPRPEIILLDEQTVKDIKAKGSHANPDTFQPAEVDPLAHVFAYMYSSGTTGKQKAIMVNDYQFLRSALNRLDPFCRGQGMFLCASQISWISWFNMISRSALADRPWLFTTTSNLDSLLEFCHKYKPTAWLGPPMFLYAILKAIENNPGRWDLSSVKEFLTGGDRFGIDVQKAFTDQLNIGVYQEYGSTEVGLIGYADLDHEPVYGSAGKIVYPTKLVNPDTEEEISERYKIGELRMKPAMMTGYLENSEETKDAFDEDGWFKTGDLCYLDQDDNVFVVDRIKAMMKYKGFEVAPNELEELIRLIPGVADTAVAGKHHEEDGSHITAFVVKAPGSNITENDIKNFLAKKNLHDAKQLRGGVIFVDKVPRNGSGKLQRRKLTDILNGSYTKDTPQ